MASGKRTTTSRKKTTSKTYNRSRKSTRKTDYLDNRLREEITLLLLLAVCIFLLLCNFGLIPSIGKVLSDIQFGLFGFAAFFAPVFVFLCTAFYLSNRGNSAAIRKMIAGIGIFVLLQMIMELIAGRVQQASKYQFTSYYLDAVNSHKGGGIFAGSITYLCHRYLGTVGTVFLVLVLLLICIVLITEKSLLERAREGGQYASEFMEQAAQRRAEREELYMEEYEQRREEQEERRLRKEEKRARAEERKRIAEEEREMRRLERRQKEEEAENERILRMDKKARGLTADTNLMNSGYGMEELDEESRNARDDMHEIMYLDDEDAMDEKEVGRLLRPGASVIGIDEPEPETITVEPITVIPPVTVEPEVEIPNDVLSAMPEPVMEEQGVVDEKAARREPPLEVISPVTTPAREKKTEPVKQTGFSVPRTEGKPASEYQFPPVNLLKHGSKSKGDSAQELKQTAYQLQNTLETFGVSATVTDISQGPAVTRYELEPKQGVKVSKIVNLADDIKLRLAATDIRIEAPIPGKSAVGIEVPNKNISMVAFRDLVESKEYKDFGAKLTFAVGKDIAGRVIVTDLAKMPHVLIAGSTGSGKSVCINTIIMSILYKSRPDEVKMILIDPKVVELSVYNSVPHLLLPVVTDPKKAAASLQWGVKEMTDRYQKFAEEGVRDLKGYNQKMEQLIAQGDTTAKKLPQILIIVDELADLMMVAAGEVEEAICRLAQLARAAGIHLVIATQRPSVDVITGLIKANMPSRIAFAVSSGVDSRTILDSNGAEKLLGKGDMLFYPQGYPKPLRVQGAFISDGEVQEVVDFLKAQHIINDYQPDMEAQLSAAGAGTGSAAGSTSSAYDDLFVQAGQFVIDKDKASIGMLQRVFKIGFNRAARIMDQLCEAGVVGAEEGTKPRRVLMSPEQFESFIEESL